MTPAAGPRRLPARAVIDIALGRIAVDRVGRTGLLLTGAVAALGCTLLGTAMAGVRSEMTPLIVHRVLGLSAVPLKWGDGHSFSGSDIRDLLTYPEVAITCTRASTAIMPTGVVIGIRRIAGTPASLAALGGGIRGGRTLRWSDTLGARRSAVVGRRLADLQGRGAHLVDEGTLRGIGVLDVSPENPTSLASITLLRPRDVTSECGQDAVVDVGIAGPLETVTARAAALAVTLQRRRGGGTPPPSPLRLMPVLPTALVRTVHDAEKATVTVLSTAMAVFVVATVITIVVLVLVRAEGRRADLAISRAVGANRSVIAAELLAEALLLGVTAGGVGAMLGWSALAVAFKALSASGPSAAIAATAFAGVVITFGMAAAWTAWDVTRQPPHQLFAGERW